MASYMYRVVSSNGAGVHSNDYRSLGKAREAGERIGASDSAKWFGPFEIERFEQRGSVRRYWVLSGKRWEPWSADRDMNVRKPALVFPAERRP